MEKKDIIAFFNERAAQWDREMIRDDAVIEELLENAGVCPGANVLDIACGTGVLFPDYLAASAASVTGVDIADRMVRIAREKYAGEQRIKVLCADAETADFGRCFDVIMVYNAFPHFPDPGKLLRRLAAQLKSGGRLCVAHGMSREKLKEHHRGAAAAVSLELPAAEELAMKFRELGLVPETVISDDRMYQVVGKKP